jgi:hypothetical protein
MMEATPMLAIMLIGGLALAIVLFAVRIVISWVSKPAAMRFDRAIDAFARGFFQVVIVLLAIGILFVVWSVWSG